MVGVGGGGRWGGGFLNTKSIVPVERLSLSAWGGTKEVAVGIWYEKKEDGTVWQLFAALGCVQVAPVGARVSGSERVNLKDRGNN